VQGERTLSFRGLADRIGRVGCGVVEGLGVAPGSHSAIFAPNCLEYFELLLGLSDAQVAPVLVGATSDVRSLAAVCNDSESRVLFVHPSLEETARAAELDTVRRIVVLGEEYESWLSSARSSRLQLPRSSDDTFVILYTSGTTGAPRGAVFSQLAKVIQYLAICAEFRTGAAKERSLTVGPLSHGATLAYALATLNAGGTAVILPIFHPEVLLRQVDRHRITNFAVVPAHLEALVGLGDSMFGRYDRALLRLVVVGSAALPPAVKEESIALFGEGVIQENYGSTEMGQIAHLKLEYQERKPGSVGPPFYGTTARIVGPDGAPLPAGEIGELHLRASSAFYGYWRRPAETEAAFSGDFFITRDLARLDEDGFIYLSDRADDTINIGGFTVQPRQIEDVLVRHPDVVEAVAFGSPDPRLGEVVHALVVLRRGAVPGERELLAFSAKHLALEKRPRRIEIVSEIPRNDVGKIVRRTLRESFPASEGLGSSASL
jgi:long-chain acyl-CoA synthetase